MTTGTIIRDLRYSATTSCGVDNNVGIIHTKSWSGDDDPELHHKENTYVMSRTTESNPLCTYRVKGSNDPWLTGSYEACGFGIVPPFYFLDIDDNDHIALINRLGTKIRGHNFNAGVFLGEGRESMAMIIDRTNRLRKFYGGIRKGNVPAALTALGLKVKSSRKGSTVNSAFLEYRYGWSPLVKDLHEAANAFFAITNRPLTRVYRASYKKEVDLTETTTSSVISGKTSITRRLRCYMEEDYSPWDSLGLTDPSEVIWELVPFSFVFDWFIPFGNYLSARGVVGDIGTAAVWQTDYRRLYKKRLNFDTPWWSYDIVGPGRYSNLVNMERKAVTLTVPKPKLNTFKQIGDFSKLRDAVSLFIAVGKHDRK